jgi:hypothetical protein
MTGVIEWEFFLSGQRRKIHGKLLRIYERTGPDSQILQTKNPPQKIGGQQGGWDGWGRGGGGTGRGEGEGGGMGGEGEGGGQF